MAVSQTGAGYARTTANATTIRLSHVFARILWRAARRANPALAARGLRKTRAIRAVRLIGPISMKYLLDTNTCIRYLNGLSPEVFKGLDHTPETDVCVCSVVKFEPRYGALRSDFVEKTLAQQDKFLSRYLSLLFDDSAQAAASKIRADLTKAGTPIGPYDLLIAAIALTNDLILVTHNTREFNRVTGLKIEDWEKHESSS